MKLEFIDRIANTIAKKGLEKFEMFIPKIENFASYMLVDGSTILEKEDGTLYTVAQDGSELSVADGEYMIANEDGTETKLIVKDSKKVEDVIVEEVPVAASEDVVVADVNQPTIEDLLKIMEGMKEYILSLESKLNSTEIEMGKYKEQFSKFQENITESKPIKVKANTVTTKEVKMSADEIREWKLEVKKKFNDFA